MEPLRFQLASAAQARAAIATLVGDNGPGSIRLGNIELEMHQVSAVTRIRKAIDEFGGALLCDPVGTGKTYVALAVAPADEEILVVAPAVLRKMWMQASSVTERLIDFVSFESLSRRAAPKGRHPLLVIDEAHHARNPRTIRYEVLSRLCTGKKVLMLTATPIHNRRTELESLLALFMGSRAGALTAPEIGRCIIRRCELSRELTAIPRADEVVWLRTNEDDRIPRALLDLPPPLPPRDGGDGGALVVHSLIRQWASSDAALTGGLRRRLARAEAHRRRRAPRSAEEPHPLARLRRGRRAPRRLGARDVAAPGRVAFARLLWSAAGRRPVFPKGRSGQRRRRRVCRVPRRCPG